MGLIEFMKDAGAKVFGIGKTSEEEALEKATKLEDAVRALDFQVENLKITVEDDKATIEGIASDMATKEKVVLVVGNTAGIASVEDNMTIAVVEEKEIEEEEKVPQAQYHMVQKGDTLGKIAKKFYGDAMKYPVIFEANKPMLKDPNLIYPGQVLRIPAL